MGALSSILKAHKFLKGLPPRYLKSLVGCAAAMQFEAEQFLFREGERANQFFLVYEGKIAIEIHAPGRGSLRIQTIGAGDVVGWSWLIRPYKWHFDAKAVERAKVIALDGEHLRRQFHRDPAFGYDLLNRFAQVMTERLSATRLQLLDLYGNQSKR